MYWPLVTGVALAWLDLKCRLVTGTPTNASRCQTILSCLQIERMQAKAVNRQRLDRTNVAGEAGAERLVLIAGGRDQEDAIAPHDRARRAKTGNRNLPFDVLARRDVPLAHHALAITNAGGVRAAKRWPVDRRGAPVLRGLRFSQPRVRHRHLDRAPPMSRRRSLRARSARRRATHDRQPLNDAATAAQHAPSAQAIRRRRSAALRSRSGSAAAAHPRSATNRSPSMESFTIAPVAAL